MQDRRQLNFAQRWREKQKEPLKAARRKSRRILAGIGVGMVVAALGSVPWLYEYRLAVEADVLNQKIASLQEIDTQVYQLEVLVSRIDAQEQLLGLITEGRKNPSEVLNRLQQQLPTGATLVSFTMDKDDSFKASITFSSPVDAANFWSGMMGSDYYETKDLDTLSLEDKEQTIDMEFKFKQ
ncbi:MAG: fimbrial assembly protein [Desulfitobacterium sp.]